VAGSLTQSNWGLEAADLDWIRNEADLFINCAASTSFVDAQSCEAINIVGTRHMLDVVKGAKKLKRLVHFSTATVCGCLPGRVITEDESLPFSANHVFAYTRTKAEAERILWAAADRVPLLVVRPSITMSWPSRDPKHAKLFLWSILGVAKLPYVPVRRESFMDIVTLDFVVESTLRLIAKGDRLSHNCYHQTAGVKYSVSCGEVQDIAIARSKLTRLPVVVAPEDWDKSHEQAIEDAGLTSVYEALQLLLPYINLDLRYDNTRLMKELGPDFPELPRFTEYLNEMIATIDPELVTTADGLAGDAFGM
jgi:nucleoside-diphosphate-sugar epimerase